MVDQIGVNKSCDDFLHEHAIFAMFSIQKYSRKKFSCNTMKGESPLKKVGKINRLALK